MLEYLTEIMEDANDFGWQSAKASHAMLLCRMEDGKVDWSETQKIDRIRSWGSKCKINQIRVKTSHGMSFLSKGIMS